MLSGGSSWYSSPAGCLSAEVSDSMSGATAVEVVFVVEDEAVEVLRVRVSVAEVSPEKTCPQVVTARRRKRNRGMNFRKDKASYYACKNRSTSMAAMHPLPAATTACR